MSDQTRTLLTALFIALIAGLGTWLGAQALAPAPAPQAAVEAPRKRLQLTPQSGTATVRINVRDSEGLPPTDCGATLWQVIQGGRRMDNDSTKMCRKGTELVWENREAGEYRLNATGDGLEMFDQTFTLADGELRDFGIVLLGPGGNISGQVLRHGEPALGATIYSSSGQKAISAAEGRFLIVGEPVGPATVKAGRESTGASAELVVEQGKATEVTLELQDVPPAGVLGLRFEPGPEGMRITEVHPSGPAAGAGVGPGDLVLAVDGKPTAGLSRESAAALLEGAPGQAVSLGLADRTVELERVDLQSLQ